MAATRKTDAKSKHLEKVISHARKKVGDNERPLVEKFIRLFYRTVAGEDLLNRTPADLFGAALSYWRFAGTRKPGEARIRTYNPTRKRDGWTTTHTVVEMVNDDMPFLVDSAGIVFQRMGHTIHLTVHPILLVERDGNGRIRDVHDPRKKGTEEGVFESWFQAQIDRETDTERLEEMKNRLDASMGDVRVSVDDWLPMRERAHEIRTELETNPPPLDRTEMAEAARFLEWLENNHFTFLGYREYRLERKDSKDILTAVPETGLGILRKHESQRTAGGFVLPPHIRNKARAKELLIITKANSFATVHRDSYMDYIGIKRFDADGKVVGERRFLGLFTSAAYIRSPRYIPLLRHKVEKVIEHSGLPTNSHAGKALLHILETFPRDELFQASTEELYEIATGVVQLQERQRVKLFVREDDFARFYSCLVYVPRDRYNTRIREKIQEILKHELEGQNLESSVQISESALARVHIIVRTGQKRRRARFNLDAIEETIAEAVRSWGDKLREALVDKFGEERGLRLFRRYSDALPTAYREDVEPRAAAYDLERMDALTDDTSLRMSLYRPDKKLKGLLRFKIFCREQPIPISDALPMLEHMGVKVISERPYSVELSDASLIWVQDFDMIHSQNGGVNLDEVKEIFQETFKHTWLGDVENDGFNQLILAARLDWRQVMLLRAYCKYLLQTGIPFSQSYMEETLMANAGLARKLVELFEIRFNPAFKGDRDEQADTLWQSIREDLDEVASLDDDRILRGFANVIRATLRTNFHQPGADGNHKEYVSFKFDPARIPDLPLPKPAFEIFVYSPRMEGVHLRGGKVARGGLRWSDRREDFRTEVLGLMKAQQVKNTLIVPMGAKGGFVMKQPPKSQDRESVMAEVVHCYKSFIRGLLDVTDNLVNGDVIHPKKVVCHDGEDPYLVVAADKGTATFSDLANEVAAEYNFWMGDAFASGGSVGYDHKKLGITARGGWESVKRHFRELGINCQTTDFTAVGIGDMGGDVFGNGMLLSRHIRLVAAFNHMHIFLDPDPDPEKSFSERERLFRLPRSTWADYDKRLISRGGGVYSRSAKSISLTPEIRAALGIDASRLTPHELIRAILRAPVDLVWNGGIGTYVKASTESHSDVGDRANDGVRVNGNELRCRVVGEGGNLGLTQLGRIEFARRAGRINTDFIDNSGGVDCSDREVNSKILLNTVRQHKRLPQKQRDKLLMDMSDEVCDLVLHDNYLQTQALTISESQAANRLNEHAYFIRLLERHGQLDRTLEYLPDEEQIAERRAAKKGLTRPELAILLAYSKIVIYSSLLDSDVPEDSYLSGELKNYFPIPLQERYAEFMPQHRLRREIIATAITNSMVNRMGPTFAHRMRDDTGAEDSEVARAYTIAREAYDSRAIWAGIEELDNRIPASVQTAMHVQVARMLKHATRWLLDRPQRHLDIAAAVERFAPGIARLNEALPDLLTPTELDRYGETVQQYMDIGVPEQLARRIGALNPLYPAFDMIEVAENLDLEIDTVCAAYFVLGERLEINWLREQIEGLPVEGHWQAVARGTLRENLYAYQRQLTALCLEEPSEGSTVESAVEEWLENNRERVQHAQRVINDMRTGGGLDFATASVALQEVRKLARTDGLATTP